MKFIYLSYRVPVFVVHLFVGVVLCVLFLRDTEKKPMTSTQHAIVKWWLGRCCRISGLKMHVVGQAVPDNHNNVCFVSNHISWLDIVILGGLHPTRFLSKSDVKRWPVIGYLASCAGTLYIQRGKDAHIAFENIKMMLEHNENVALFPEGTTSKDYSIRRFHPRLFSAAIDARVAVQPIAIAYPSNAHNSAPNIDILFTDNQSFFTNALRVLGRRRTLVEIHYLDVLRDSKDLNEVKRETLATKSRDAIENTLKQIYEGSL